MNDNDAIFEGAELGPLCALVVESRDEIRTLLSASLHAVGIGHVRAAADGRQALEWLHAGLKADILLCNWQLPDMNAAELLQQASAYQPGMAAVVLIERREKPIRHGRLHWLQKPFSPDQLEAKIRIIAHQLPSRH